MFVATFSNLWNERAVVAVHEQVDSPYGGGTQYATPGGQAVFNGPAFHAAAMKPWRVSEALNGANGASSTGGPIAVSSLYGKPLAYQQPRNIRLAVRFTF